MPSPKMIRWPARRAGGPGATRRAGPGAALTSRFAERDRAEGTTRTGRPIGRTAGAPEISRERSAARVINERTGPAGIRPAEVVTSSGGSDRPHAGGPGRSFRSLSSPANLLSVAGGHGQAGIHSDSRDLSRTSSRSCWTHESTSLALASARRHGPGTEGCQRPVAVDAPIGPRAPG